MYTAHTRVGGNGHQRRQKQAHKRAKNPPTHAGVPTKHNGVAHQMCSYFCCTTTAIKTRWGTSKRNNGQKNPVGGACPSIPLPPRPHLNEGEPTRLPARPRKQRRAKTPGSGDSSAFGPKKSRTPRKRSEAAESGATVWGGEKPRSGERATGEARAHMQASRHSTAQL